MERDKKGKFKKANPFSKNKHEILYNLINSLLSGALVFLGAIADGKLTKEEIGLSMGAAGVVAFIKFKEYWDGEKKEYTSNIFNWI